MPISQASLIDELLLKIGERKPSHRGTENWEITLKRSGFSGGLSLIKRHDFYRIIGAELTWAENHLVSAVYENLRQLWGRKLKIWHKVKEDGKLAIIVEYRPPPSPSKRGEHLLQPPAAVGWTISLTASGNLLRIYFDNHFSIGPAPVLWFSDITQASLKAICARASRSSQCKSIFEFELPVGLILAANANQRLGAVELQTFEQLAYDQAGNELQTLWKPTERNWTISSQRSNRLLHSPVLPSMNVLESRALHPKIHQFDLALIDRKQRLPSLEGVSSQITLRKYLQSDLSGINLELPESPIGQSQSILAQSCQLRQAVRTRDWDRALKVLQDVTDLIRSNYGDLEEIAPLHIATAELAGDILSGTGSDHALKAYDSALLQAKEPRIFEKAVAVSKALNQESEEMTLLTEWLKVEKRSAKIANIAERQSALYILRHQPKMALDVIESLLNRRISPGAWAPKDIEHCAALGEPIRALDVLSRIENAALPAQGHSAAVKAAVGEAMANIWINTLKRPDLGMIRQPIPLKVAKTRLAEEKPKRRLRETPTPKIEKPADPIDIWRLLSKQEKAQQVDLALKVLFDNGRTRTVTEQFDLVIEILESGTIVPVLNEILISWFDRPLPWRKLMDASLPYLDQDVLDTALKTTLAEISRHKLGDHSSAVRILTTGSSAAVFGHTDFEYVMENLFDEKKTDQARSVVLEKLRIARKLSTNDPRALRLAVRLNLGDESQDFNNDLCRLWKTDQSPDLINERLHHLIQAGQLDDCHKLIRTLLENIGEDEAALRLTGELLETISQSSAAEKADLAKPLIDRRVQLGGYASTSIVEAIARYDSLGDLDQSRDYIRQAVESHLKPPLDPEQMETLFKGDYDLLGKYYRIMHDFAEADYKCGFARLSLLNQKQGDLWTEDSVPCFAALISSSLLSEGDLDDLRQVAIKTKNHRLLVGGLIQLARAEVDFGKRRLLVQEASEICTTELGDPVLNYEIIAESYQDRDERSLQLEVAEAAVNAGRVEHATEICARLLQDPRPLQDEDLLIRVLEIAAATRTDDQFMVMTLQSLKHWASQDGEHSLINRLNEFASKHGLASEELLGNEISRLAEEDQFDAVLENLTRLIRFAQQNKRPIAAVFDDVYRALPEKDRDATWWQLLGALHRNETLAGFASSSRQEIKYRFANWLYQSDATRQQALKLFLQFHEEYPEDHRSWVPIYLLLEETSDDLKLSQHLETIIPQIESNPTIIELLPISVGSMKSTLNRTRVRISQNQIKRVRFERVAKAENNLLTSNTPAKRTIVDSLTAVQGSAAHQLTELQSIAESRDKDSATTTHQAELEQSKEVVETPEFSQPGPQTNSLADRAIKVADSEPSLPPLDWRTMAHLLDAPKDAVERIIRTAFASETEKHIALQVAGILSGDLESLEQWHWRVWKYPDEFNYGLSSSTRLPEGRERPATLRTPQYKFMMMVAPALARALKDKLSVERVLKQRFPQARLGLRRLNLDSPSITRSGLKHFSEKLVKGGFSFIDTPELKTEILVDPFVRTIHFSEDAVQKMPPGFLLHRVRYQAFAVASGFFSITQADAKRDIAPYIDQVVRMIQSSPLQRIKDGFNADMASIQKTFHPSEVAKLKAQFSLCESIGLRDIAKLQQDLTLHNFRVQLAGTLDLVGLIEAILGANLDQMNRDQFIAVLNRSPVLKDIIMFSTSLRF